MKIRNITFVAGLLAALTGGTAFGQTEIIGDGFNVSSNGTGFNLEFGVNSGISTNFTRLTGTAKDGLRYISIAGNRTNINFSIATNKFLVKQDGSQTSTVVLSEGTGAVDFGPKLGIAAVSSTNKAVYDVRIKMASYNANTARTSFAIGTQAGTAGTWDFGVQLFRPTTGASTYSVFKRISLAAGGVTNGVPAALNSLITTTPSNTHGKDVSILIRVTDAGSDAVGEYNSQLQMSIDGTTNNWVYDTATDPDLPNGWRLGADSRYFLWDTAGATATYDDFSVTLNTELAIGNRIWTGGDATLDTWSSGANWGGTAPGNGDTLTFNGTTRQANVNDIVNLTVPWLTFNNGGFSLSGNPFIVTSAVTNKAGINTIGNLAWTAIATKQWHMAPGSEVVLNGTTAIDVNGDNYIVGGGALRVTGALNIGQASTAVPAFIVNEGQHIVDGGTFASRGGYRIGSLATGVGGQTIVSNATFSLTVPGANLRVGDSANPNTSRLDLYNSTLTMDRGALTIPYAVNATGLVAQVGGTVSGCDVVFSDAGAGKGTYTILNGTLEPLQIREDTVAGSSSIHFDNAVLSTAAGASNAFFSGLNVAEIQAGGLTIVASSDVTIAQPLSGVGALTKVGSSKVTLTGANTYLGNTLIQSGSLYYPTTRTNATIVQVADGAGLGVVVTTAGTAALTEVNFAGTGKLNFDWGTLTTPTVPLLSVPTLSAAGTVTVNVANGRQLTVGTVVLVDYDSLGGAGQIVLGTVPPGVTATLTNNTSTTAIELIITDVSPLRWTGTLGGSWDLSTLNWIDVSTSQAAAFENGYPLLFPDDAATGSISIDSSLSPIAAAIVVSNSTLPYVWSGETPITAPTLKKDGNGTLTRVGGETDVISGIELNAGSFVAEHTVNSTFATVLTDAVGGTGTFVKKGATTMTISSASSTYDGAMVIQEGTVKIGANRSLGSTVGGTTIADGATLDLTGFVPGFEPIVVSGAGVNGLGAIIDSVSTGSPVDTNLRDVTLAGHTTFGAVTNRRWDIRVRSSSGTGPGLQGNGFNLTKVGSGSVSIAAQRNLLGDTPYWQMNLGDILVSAGSLAFAESVSLGNPSASLTISSGASLQLYDLGLTNPILRTITMTGATLSAGGAATDTNVVNGAIQLSGANSIHVDKARLIINGAMGGSGASVTVTADATGGTLLLNGVNTYTGNTVVNSGTIGGFGVIAGNLTVNTATTAPGSSGVGTLTVNGNLKLGATTTMEVDRSKSPNSDRLVANGSLTYGTTLNVVLGAGAPAPQAGDVYQLFNKAGSGSFTSVNLPNLTGLPGGLAWDTSKLAVDGTITVTGTATPPTIGNVSVTDGTLTFAGTGGIEGNTYLILSSTNVALPVVSWTPVATNTFGAGGTFSYSSSVNPGAPATFYLLQLP